MTPLAPNTQALGSLFLPFHGSISARFSDFWQIPPSDNTAYQEQNYNYNGRPDVDHKPLRWQNFSYLRASRHARLRAILALILYKNGKFICNPYCAAAR